MIAAMNLKDAYSVDRGNNAQGEGGPVKYKVRSNANLSSVGYYSATTKFGRLTQNGW